MRKEIESLRKVNEECKESPQEEQIVDVEMKYRKNNYILNYEIEAQKPDDEFIIRDGWPVPDGFKVDCDKPGVAKVTMKNSYKNEIINIEVFNPAYYDQHLYEEPPFKMKLIVKVSFSGIFSSTVAEFHCTALEDELIIDKIKDPSDGHSEGVIFKQLPDSLQTEFYNYLEVRGVVDNIGDSLHYYMMDKMDRENTRGLGNFQKLLEVEERGWELFKSC